MRYLLLLLFVAGCSASYAKFNDGVDLGPAKERILKDFKERTDSLLRVPRFAKADVNTDNVFAIPVRDANIAAAYKRRRTVDYTPPGGDPRKRPTDYEVLAPAKIMAYHTTGKVQLVEALIGWEYTKDGHAVRSVTYFKDSEYFGGEIPPDPENAAMLKMDLPLEPTTFTSRELTDKDFKYDERGRYLEQQDGTRVYVK